MRLTIASDADVRPWHSDHCYRTSTHRHGGTCTCGLDTLTVERDAATERAEKAEAERDRALAAERGIGLAFDQQLTRTHAYHDRLDAVRALVVKMRESAMQYEDDGYSGIADDMREHADEIETALGDAPTDESTVRTCLGCGEACVRCASTDEPTEGTI